MYRRMAIVAVCVATVSTLVAQQKEEERLANSATVLQEITSAKGLPKNVLEKADCVLIFPSVKKVAVGIGTSYGRGALVCRQGPEMKGAWGAPAMYALDSGSLGLQLGSSATDFVLVVMNPKGAEQILNGKTKLGGNAAAAAGPTGAQTTGFNSAAMTADVLTYSRTKGVFAGASLGGAKIDGDQDANKALYGKDLSAKEIVQGNQEIVPAAKPLVDELNKLAPARQPQ
jgi:lipid-binding SYLF domain-containing protein